MIRELCSLIVLQKLALNVYLDIYMSLHLFNCLTVYLAVFCLSVGPLVGISVFLNVFYVWASSDLFTDFLNDSVTD